jgi:hypothetical protein
LEKRTGTEQSGNMATAKYYLDPMYGATPAILSLRARINDGLQGEEGENTRIALIVLTRAQEATQAALAELRTEAAKRAGSQYVRSRTNGACGSFVLPTGESR